MCVNITNNATNANATNTNVRGNRACGSTNTGVHFGIINTNPTNTSDTSGFPTLYTEKEIENGSDGGSFPRFGFYSTVTGNMIYSKSNYPGDAGFDIASTVTMSVAPHKIIKVPTGVKLINPTGRYGQIQSRSSTAFYKGLVVGGVIDSGYTGEIFVLLHNTSDEKQIVYENDRIAQVIIMPYFVYVDTQQINQNATTINARVINTRATKARAANDTNANDTNANATNANATNASDTNTNHINVHFGSTNER